MSQSNICAGPPSAIGNHIELGLTPLLSGRLNATGIQPRQQILTLADIEYFEIPTSVDDTLNALTSNSYTPPNGEIFQLQKMHPDTT